MNPNILLVEDDPVSRAFLEAATAALPATVAVAGDATSARRLANATAFDLWLLDANLPDATGAELLAQLREAGFDTPAIAHTATRDADTHAELRAAGFAGTIAKPIDAASWQAALRRALQVSPGAHVEDVATHRYGERPLWDDAAALAALNGNSEHVAVLRQLFLDELPGMRARIVDAGTRQDTLHRLRASCGFVGAARLADAVQALQESQSEAALQRVLDTLQDTLDQAPSR
ncbi:response regulator [Pseudoluteimonas lycopersici]|uniref:Response regulator n=1 Tax=Pseudoluteimonas lycopersici TaxID=1324796 RepID=A0A516V294_9GAMM|nr:response regulator [Lysobacter lycopersici]QDQ72635.1 response regulator [Lysobacter lycopersici]